MLVYLYLYVVYLWIRILSYICRILLYRRIFYWYKGLQYIFVIISVILPYLLFRCFRREKTTRKLPAIHCESSAFTAVFRVLEHQRLLLHLSDCLFLPISSRTSSCHDFMSLPRFRRLGGTKSSNFFGKYVG